MLGDTIVKNVAQVESEAVLVASCGAAGQRSIVVSVSVCYRTAVVDTHTHPFNGRLSGTTQVGRYQKGKIDLDFIGVRDSEWQWRQLGHMQGCTSLQTDNHTSTPPLSFLQAGCPSWRPTNSVEALQALNSSGNKIYKAHVYSLWPGGVAVSAPD